MQRNLMRSRSVVEVAVVIAAVIIVAAGAGPSGCDRRMYPAHNVLTNVNVDAAGSLEVSGQFNQCPTASFSVSPVNVPADRPVDVTGAGSDPDDAGALVFRWTATAGSFDDASARQTVFHCAEPGPVTITLVVSDGSCDTPSSGAIYCLGTHQDGGGGAGGGPPDNARDGGAGGMGGASGLGGRGMGGRPGTGGAPGTGGRSVVDTCTLTPAEEPPASASAACDDCTSMNCSLELIGTDGCCALTSATDRALCAAVVTCDSAHSQDCTSAGDPTNCFCGTGLTNCFTVPGVANGPCVAEWAAAAKTSDVRMIKAQITLPTSVLGRANNLLLCRGSFCSTECGIQ